MAKNSTQTKITEGDRVVRADTKGPVGTVQKVRMDTTRTSIKEEESMEQIAGVTVTVLWDNGTLSHFVPDSLQRV